MTTEEKQLLFIDLCAKLPYGLVINTSDKNLVLDRQHQGIGILYPEDCSDEFNERNNNASFYITISGCYYGEEIKPYLRPVSSMTEEEYKKFTSMCAHFYEPKVDGVVDVPYIQCYDWLNKNHFDYRGLIEKGLALVAPKGMYN